MNINLKKLCVVALSAMMTVTSLGNVVFADEPIEDEIYEYIDEDADKAEGDIDESEIFNKTDKEEEVVSAEGTLMAVCPKQYELLKSLGVLEDNYKADEPVTRSMFAVLMCRLTGATDGSVADYEDVTEDMANSGAVGIAQYNQYMIGYGDGKFLPKKAVTQKEGIIALLKTAGYGPVMNSKYYKMSDYYADLLVSGCTLEDELNWENTVKLIYNALFSKTMEIKSMSGYSPNYGVSETLLLEKLYDLQKETGIIVADRYAALGDRKKVGEETVVIKDSDGDFQYSTGDSGIEDHVGYHVTFFYDSDNAIFAYTLDENKMNINEVSEQTFIEINRDFTELKYDANGKTKKVKIAPNADIVYNGVEYYGITEADFENADLIRTVDGDNDNKADIIYIYNYESTLVNTVSVIQKLVTDKRSDVADVYFDEGEYDDIVFYKDGLPASLSIVSEWDILSIAKSKGDTKRMIVNISSDMIEGNVKLVSEKKRTVKVDGEEYYVTNKVDIKRLDGNIIVGLNESGVITVFTSVSDTDKQYGYLLKMGYDKHAEELYITYLDDTMTEKEATISKKFYLGKKKVEIKKIADAAQGLYDNGEITNVPEQLFGYKTDVNGNIKRLYFASTTPVGNTTATTDTDTLVYNAKTSNKRFLTGFVNNEYVLTTDTKSFLIVTDAEGKAIPELSLSFTNTTNAVTNGSRPTCYVYDADESCRVGAFVMSIPATQAVTYLEITRAAIVVKDVIQTVNEDDEIVYAAECYLSGAEGVYYGEGGVDVSEWKTGDVYSVRLKGDKIYSAIKQFGVDDTSNSVLSPAVTYTESNTAMRNFGTATSGASQTGDSAEIVMGAYGELKELLVDGSTSVVRMRPYGITTDRIYQVSGATTYYLLDTTNKTVETITQNDLNKIMSDGKVFVASRYQNALTVMLVD